MGRVPVGAPWVLVLATPFAELVLLEAVGLDHDESSAQCLLAFGPVSNGELLVGVHSQNPLAAFFSVVLTDHTLLLLLVEVEAERSDVLQRSRQLLRGGE